jgi:hypothetical protein
MPFLHTATLFQEIGHLMANFVYRNWFGSFIVRKGQQLAEH